MSYGGAMSEVVEEDEQFEDEEVLVESASEPMVAEPTAPASESETAVYEQSAPAPAEVEQAPVVESVVASESVEVPAVPSFAAPVAMPAPIAPASNGIKTWLQCEILECEKWRLIPEWVTAERLADLRKRPFYCYLNPDLTKASCDEPEEQQDPAEVQL